MPASILDRLLADARRRAGALRRHEGALRRSAHARDAPPSLVTALRTGQVTVIAEVKRRSPSAGVIRGDLDAVAQARAYVAGGAVAVSVLTEERQFGGAITDLRAVADAVAVPVLRKDFLVDPLQLLEARAAGASAVLLIARALPLRDLARLIAAAHKLGLETLVEAHTESEVAAGLEAGATALGINSRDLRTFAIDLTVTERLLPRVPPGVCAVAESGIATRDAVERVAAAGADAVLVGTHVAAAPDPAAAVRALVGVVHRGRR